MIRVLITAGNTVVPIDRVRGIGNVFRGRTGANIALEAHRRGHAVHLLTSDPDVLRSADVPRDERWVLAHYRTFDDLHAAMHSALGSGGVDALIHSAAVSDYRVGGIFAPAAGAAFRPETPGRETDSDAGVVNGDEPELWLRLVPTPKLVDLVRAQWHFAGVLVKFKLEVGADEQRLRSVAEASRTHSGADLVVANTLLGLTLIGPVYGRYERLSSRRELAERLLTTVEQLAAERKGGAS